MTTKPKTASSTGVLRMSPSCTGTACALFTMPASKRPMNVRNRPMPAAKLCFIDGEIDVGEPRAHAEERDDQEDHAADEHRAEALLPGDAERREAERDERVLAHVRRDRERAVRVEAHQQRAEDRGEDRGDGARSAAGTARRTRIAGLTTMMYAIETNVVTPPTTSVRTVDPRSRI